MQNALAQRTRPLGAQPPSEKEKPVKIGKRKADLEDEVQFQPRKTAKPDDGVFILKRVPPPDSTFDGRCSEQRHGARDLS